jgi:drug/metabolite transporter (DMT)-like permease
MGVFVKLGAEHFDAAELAFYRNFVSLVFVGGIVAIRGGSLKTEHGTAHFIRGLTGSISLIGYFYGMTQLPLATAQTLNYTSPLFLAIATVVVLGEKFSGWLIAAIALGFVGVAILLQPTIHGGKEAAALIGLFSGVFSAWAYLSVRTLGKLGEPDWRVVFWFTAIGALRRMAAIHFQLPRAAMGQLLDGGGHRPHRRHRAARHDARLSHREHAGRRGAVILHARLRRRAGFHRLERALAAPGVGRHGDHHRERRARHAPGEEGAD